MAAKSKANTNRNHIAYKPYRIKPKEVYVEGIPCGAKAPEPKKD